MPVGEVAEDMLLERLSQLKATTVATAMDGIPYGEVELDPMRSTALLLGSEAHGLGADILASAAVQVSIPMHGKVESLNVATTGAVLAFALRSNH